MQRKSVHYRISRVCHQDAIRFVRDLSFRLE